jgi:hypothetical protein
MQKSKSPITLSKCGQCIHLELNDRTYIKYDKTRKFIRGRINPLFWCNKHGESLNTLRKECRGFTDKTVQTRMNKISEDKIRCQ